jgi:hypothetical protein
MAMHHKDGASLFFRAYRTERAGKNAVIIEISMAVAVLPFLKM